MLNQNIIPILCIGGMLIGILFSVFTPKGDPRQKRALSVFIFGAAVLLGNWLLKNPEILNDAENNLGWILLGIVFGFIELIRKQ